MIDFVIAGAGLALIYGVALVLLVYGFMKGRGR